MASHAGHSMSSSSSSSSSGMQMTFFSAHTTPLYSPSWTPSSTASYAGTCIFLILLSSAWRALFVFKQLLERRWLDRDRNRRYVVVAGERREKERVSDDVDAAKALLLSASGVEEDVRVVRRHVRGPVPWRLSVDLPRAAVVTILAGVGYLLMLAVMTYNVGYFLSVLGGVFLGELVMGRYSNAEEH